MKSKLFAAALVLALAGFGGYFYASPFSAMQAMARAANAGDAERFNAMVDYPSLRESLKGEFAAVLSAELSKTQSQAQSVLNTAAGMAVVNQLVDTFVRPEVFIKIIAEGKLKAESEGTSIYGPGSPGANSTDPKWVVEWVSLDRVIVYEPAREKATGAKAGLVLVRSGFATWRVSEIRLPANLK